MADESPQKPKRRLRAAPVTVRERAEQAQPKQEGKTPKLARKPRKAFAPFRAIKKVLRFITPKYFRNSWHELRQVKWPNWRESVRLTGAVLIFAIIFGIIIALADFGLDKVFKKVILKQ